MRRSYDKIQYLRAVAAYMVVVSHFLNVYHLGAFGVAIFFSISGFIMTITSWEKFDRPGAPTDFLVRRVLRIYPLWWITLLAKMVIDSRPKDLLWVVGSVLLLPVPAPSGFIEPIHGVGWSLTWEMMFYFVFAVGLMLDRFRGLMFVSAVLFAATVAGVLIPEFKDSAWHANQIFLLFLAGVGVGSLSVRSIRLAPPALPMGIAILLGIYLVATDPKGLPAELAYLVSAALMVYACALFANSRREHGLDKLLHFLGDASYSLYLTHPLVLSLMASLSKHGILDLDPPAFVAVGLLLSTLAGALCYVFVERPITRLTKGLGLRPRVQGAKA